MIDAAGFGVRADPTIDNGPRINAAMQYAAQRDLTSGSNGQATFGGLVRLPPGVLITAEPIVVPDRVSLVGEGMKATRITAANGLNAPVIQTYKSVGTESDAQGCLLAHLMVDGNAAGQTGKWDGVVWGGNTYKATGSEEWDGMHTIDSVMVKNCAGHGFLGRGHQSSTWQNLRAYYCGVGFNPNYDTAVDNCVAGRSAGPGFILDNSGIYLSNCKSFYSGQPGYDYPGIVAVLNQGFGYLVKGALSGTSASSCHAQDSIMAGWRFENGQGFVGSALVSDSNSHWGMNVAPAYDFNNYVDAQLSAIDSSLRLGNGARQYQFHAVRFLNNADRNKIYGLSHRGVGIAVLDKVYPGSVMLSNQIL